MGPFSRQSDIKRSIKNMSAVAIRKEDKKKKKASAKTATFDRVVFKNTNEGHQWTPQSTAIPMVLPVAR